MISSLLSCPNCNWQTTCGEEQIATRLRTLGLLRRAPNPPEELVAELLRSNVSRLSCDQCASIGLLIAPADDRDDDWQQAVVCEVCRKPIPLERLEIFPKAKRCVACQDVADRGEDQDEPDFCPKCGALVELRVSRASGITRYKQFCTGTPSCRL